MMDKKVKPIEYEYDVFVLILDQTGITRMQRFFLNTSDLLMSMRSLSVKDIEAFEELQRSDTGWIMVNDNQTLIVKSGIDTNFITTFRRDGNLR